MRAALPPACDRSEAGNLPARCMVAYAIYGTTAVVRDPRVNPWACEGQSGEARLRKLLTGSREDDPHVRASLFGECRKHPRGESRGLLGVHLEAYAYQPELKGHWRLHCLGSSRPTSGCFLSPDLSKGRQ